MKAKDMREKSSADLLELEKSLTRDAFQARFKNFTNRLDDTSSLKKARREVARVKTLLTERARAKTAEALPTKDAPKAAAPKAAAPAKKAADPKAAAPKAKKESTPKAKAPKAAGATKRSEASK
jgi:large subunit ribosomal protein L29